MPSLRKTSSKAPLNLLSRSWIRNRHAVEQAREAEVARLLGHPGAGRIRGVASEVDATAFEFDEEEQVEAAERDRLDGEEVAGEHAGGLPAEEFAPARA